MIQNGENGKSACWLNSVLYAFLAHPFLMKLPEYMKQNIDTSKNEFKTIPDSNYFNNEEEISRKIFEQLKTLANGDGWNNNTYRDIYNLMENNLNDKNMDMYQTIDGKKNHYLNILV